MRMKSYDMKAYQKKIKHEMDDGRYQHTLGVMYTCAALAMRYEYDIQKAQLAGLLHDCAKCIPNGKKLKLCEKHHIQMTEVERRNPFLLHAKLGAFLAKEQYDVVILDPPAFTKTRSAVEGALRGYKEINLRGMKLTRDGGFFITCSCSQHVTPDLFRGMLLEAQKDAHVQLRQIEWRTQGRDHPILLASPETQYLKCGIFQVFK